MFNCWMMKVRCYLKHVYVAVDENLTEPLMTDATIDELGIQVISFRRGLWRHTNDPPNTVRKSAK